MESDSDFKPAEAFNKGVDFIPNDESDSEEASVQLANKRGEGGSPSQVRRNTSGLGSISDYAILNQSFFARRQEENNNYSVSQAIPTKSIRH